MRAIQHWMDRLYEKRFSFLEKKLHRRAQEQRLRSEIQEKSHSLLWVWEFSKKAVMICFFFYMAVQVYAMAVMLAFSDLSYLGELITTTGNLVENCVFMYLIKAGLENGVKIWQKNRFREADSNVPTDDDTSEPVG